MTRLLTGLDLSVTSAKMVQIRRDRHIWKLVRAAEMPLPPGTLDMSNKTENIVDPEGFLTALRTVLERMEGRVSRVGLSLPSEVIKISIHTYDELPKSREKIHEIIAWKEKDLLPFPVEKARTSFFQLNGMNPGKESLLVAVGSQEIIRNYEMHLKTLHIDPEIVQPSAINHLNFYLDHLPVSGICAFLGILEDYFAFFVFKSKELIFYRGKRKQSLHERFLQEISMTMQLYEEEHPGKPIETLFVQSQVALPKEFHSELRRDSDFRIKILEEEAIVEPDPALRDRGKTNPLSFYASAIGAAQSLSAR